MSFNKFINWSIFLLLTIVWGSSFILMKDSKKELTGVQIAAFRIFCAGAVFLPFAVVHIFKILRRKLLLVILSAVTGNLLPAYLFATAISNGVESALASILNALTPLCVILVAITVFRNKISPQKIIGVLLGFAGVVLLLSTS